jgi:hypothetical protein
MSKIKQLKSEIERALFYPPDHKQMLNELRMENLRLRQKNGNIELFKTINPALVERVWKTLKISQIVGNNSKELGELGISTQQLMAQAHSLVLGAEQNLNNNLLSNPIEGFANGDFLEIEIFKKAKTTQN